MKVYELLSLLRSCSVNIILNSNECVIAVADIYFYGSSSNVDFCDIHINTTDLMELSVNDIYAKGHGLFDIYVS